MKKAENFRNQNLKNILFSILENYKHSSLRMKMLNEKSDLHQLSIIKIRTIYGWKNIMKQRKLSIQKAELFRDQKIKNNVWKGLTDWFFRSKCEKIKKNKFKNLENWFNKKKRFKHWKKELDVLVDIREKFSIMENLHNRNLKLLAIKRFNCYSLLKLTLFLNNSFKKHWYSRKRMFKTLSFLMNKNECNLLRNVFKSIKIHLRQKKLNKQKVINEKAKTI
jgi:hypothetical protein